MGFSEQLKALRNERLLTLKTLAAITGLSIGFLSDLETGRGKPSLDTLYVLAHALKADMNTLTDFQGEAVTFDVRVSNMLRVLDVDSLSPLDALTKLYELKREAKK